ncbi:SidA/IucD/PvdA family monooxygenase [Streptomyces sp. 5-6(2022)]|uniref:lysine N(6)-hydroxylase/L-ornithine N(5)-oxygenase family protein n=1 Tax=Streptomyces sp. 5-6(2022) TaxID=2936510 RepID=UPI0023B91323|nr:SidA/IucD/PvdA family monooxygenase [Streptomyces sp. 5-6(2022)]
MTTHDEDQTLDLLGVGIGPFNLSLAALADRLPRLRTAFVERGTSFQWHPGMMIEASTLQVPFLADLVTLVDPTSPWSFLNYMHARERLFPFYFAERFHIHRAEYDAYCRWVSEQLPSCRFGHVVDTVRWNRARGAFEADLSRVRVDGGVERAGRLFARHLALGVGTAPHVPDSLRPLAEDAAVPVWHSADYLPHREDLLAAGHVTVVGSGQSGAEVFLDLLRNRPVGRERLTWVARTAAFAPMEYSKLGLEQFTPDYTHYFYGLAEPVRDQLVPRQWQLYKGISADTLGDIQDELYRRSLDGSWPDVTLTPGIEVRSVRRMAGRLELRVEHTQQSADANLATDAVVLATGYAERSIEALIEPLTPHLVRDVAGRLEIDEEYRLVMDEEIGGSVFVQNAGLHTHGVGSPDLGLAAWRSAVMLNALTGECVYPLPRRTAFTTFGLEGLRRSRCQSAVPSAGVHAR